MGFCFWHVSCVIRNGIVWSKDWKKKNDELIGLENSI